MSERVSRIFLFPSLSSCSTRLGSTSSPTPTASRPWKSTMTTSPFMRVSMFMGAKSYNVDCDGRGAVRADLREPAHLRGDAVEFDAIAPCIEGRKRDANVDRLARLDLARRLGEAL